MVSMNPLTAVAFILGSATLLLLLSQADQERARMAGRGLAVLVTAIGVARLGDYLFHWNLGIDELLFRADLEHDTKLGLPNRMAPNTALNFILCGIALAVVDHPVARRFHFAETLTLVSAMIAVQAIIGYAYSTRELYRVASFIPMAFNTAVAFALLCAGILCARPDRGIMAVLCGKGAGSVMARRFLPVAVILLLVIGWLRVLGQHKGLYDLDFGAAFFATVTIILLSFTILSAAASLNRTERARRRAEQQQLMLASSAIGSAIDGIVIADRDNRIVSVNPAFTALTGHAEVELLGRNLRAYESPSEDAQLDLTRGELLRESGHWQGETWLRTKTGELLPNLMTVSAVRDNFGEISHFLTIFKDLSQHKRDQARLEFLANHDPLTNLANRKRLLEWLDSALGRARFAEGAIRVLLINIDRFHEINDSLGNPAGDLVLQAVAQR
ncbi:MAG: PAS domain S-box protein, partial [Burkholderiales bacterium]